MDNIGGIQEQMGNVRRELETKNKKTVLEIKNIVAKMKYAFHELINTVVKERIGELEEIAIETFKTETQRERKEKRKRQNRIFKTCGAITNV